MRIFVLCTGRCGSLSFAKACKHATNYTVGHESGRRGGYTLEYPCNHIEVDNRLAWFLGRLGERYPNARCVHLTRNRLSTAESFAARGVDSTSTILSGFVRAIKQHRCDVPDLQGEALSMVDTINANIRQFLWDKEHITIDIDHATKLFPAFWDWIEAEGDPEAAVAEFGKKYHDRKARYGCQQ